MGLRFFLVFLLSATAASARTVVLVCYPGPQADDCSATEKTMKACGFTVRRLNDPEPRDILDLRKEDFPQHVPALVSGDGGQAYDGAGKRYLYLTRPNARLVRARQVREALTVALPAPAIWFSACRAGTACGEDSPCFGNHCFGFAYPPYAKREQSTLSEISALLCDPKAAAWGADGVIDAAELNKLLCQKHGGPRAALELKVTAAEAAKVRKRFTGQPGLAKVEEEAYSLGPGGRERKRLVKFTATFTDGCAEGIDPKGFTLHLPPVSRSPAYSAQPNDL
jgi:hypothetical protein